MILYELLRKFVKLSRSIFFYTIYFKKLHHILKQINVERLKLFRFIDWHDGYAYFVAYKDGKKVFIKMDLFLQFLGNEYLSFKTLKNKVNLLPIKEIYTIDGYQVLVSPFVEGKNLTESDLIEKPDLLNDIFNILETINNQGIIHRDIRLENFMLINAELYIIDFTFACGLPRSSVKNDFKRLSLNSPPQKKILRNLGAKINPSEYVWNDFYSVDQIIKRMLKNNKDMSQEVRVLIEKYKVKFERAAKLPHTTYSLVDEANS
jgi:serine/threonine protein kinase